MEMISLVASFLVVTAIPVVVLGSAAIGKRWLGKTTPTRRELIRDALSSAGGTVAIIVAISYALTWAGFSEAQFYRPSRTDYGAQTELGLAPEEVYFESADNTRLHGWFLPAKSDPQGTVIHLHGSDRNISYAVRNSHWLIDHGFHLFCFDYRGYGRSEGQPSREGLLADAVAAIDYVRSRPDKAADKICLWGQSMGGQLAIVAAVGAGFEKVRAVVAEATYASYPLQVKDKVAALGPLWLVQWGVWLATPDTHAAEDIVDRLAPTPLLLVHGTEDRAVLPYHSERLFDAAREPKAIWRVEGVGHLQVFANARFRERLVGYLEDAVK